MNGNEPHTNRDGRDARDAREDWADDLVARVEPTGEVDRALREALGRSPSLREETVTRMADAVRAAAQGLDLPACAVAAGVPERMLREWLELDVAFATAVGAAHALADAHGLRPGAGPTPARLRLLLAAMRDGTPWPAAAALAGFSIRGFDRLRRESPAVGALMAAAQRARSGKRPPRGGRRTGRPARPANGYRLVRRDDPLLSPERGTATG
ncbi:hypothetical protein [Streptomyces sp. NPDC048603]|uniref:hypothetical protein n=1 Tax=Streptomyces sp. NPDC048603 TaxID=3365577 RepID=UPI0037105597